MPTTPSSPLSLKSFANAAEALTLIESLSADFKKQFQRNPNVDLNLSTVSRPSLHGEGKAFAVNQYGKMANVPKPRNDFGGAMSYKAPIQDTYEIVVRWDVNDTKASKDAVWLYDKLNKRNSA